DARVGSSTIGPPFIASAGFFLCLGGVRARLLTAAAAASQPRRLPFPTVVPLHRSDPQRGQRRRPPQWLASSGSCCPSISASVTTTPRPLDSGSLQERKHTVIMVHFKNRYMVMEVFIDAGKGEYDPVILTQFNITKVIRDSIQLNFGECGLAASLGSLQVKYVNPVTKVCIIRVSREDHQKVWTAITMVRGIGKIPVSFNLLDVSGSIRACKTAAMECDEAKFQQYKLAAGDRITPEIIQTVQTCFDKIRGLES
ncbi:unnamed protein product, partial [Urochloa humidicola]